MGVINSITREIINWEFIPVRPETPRWCPYCLGVLENAFQLHSNNWDLFPFILHLEQVVVKEHMGEEGDVEDKEHWKIKVEVKG